MKPNLRKHRKLIHEIISIALILATVFGGVLTGPQPAEAATYTFTQTNWSGGATTSTATHPTNQTGWI